MILAPARNPPWHPHADGVIPQLTGVLDKGGASQPRCRIQSVGEVDYVAILACAGPSQCPLKSDTVLGRPCDTLDATIHLDSETIFQLGVVLVEYGFQHDTSPDRFQFWKKCTGSRHHIDAGSSGPAWLGQPRLSQIKRDIGAIRISNAYPLSYRLSDQLIERSRGSEVVIKVDPTKLSGQTLRRHVSAQQVTAVACLHGFIVYPAAREIRKGEVEPHRTFSDRPLQK